ncbi:MAG: ankyrin repeat domain-containing protein [Oligoflexia bacterium]|nr:ankyrin repeat domain-containing protein [Oligoflexia bacterium]
MIRKGYDLSSVDKMGMPALIVAAMIGSIEMVDLLISCAANLNVKNKTGQTALMVASKNGYFDIVDLLVMNGADADEQDINGMTAIMYAIGDTHLDIVKFFIEKNVNLEIKDKHGRSAILFALHSLEPVEVDSLNFLEQDLKKAIEINDVELQKINELKLKRERRKLEVQGKMIEITKDITEKGVNLNIQDNELKTVCMYAVEKKQFSVVEDLLKKGVDLTLKDKLGRTVSNFAGEVASSSMSQMINVAASQQMKISEELEEASTKKLDVNLQELPKNNALEIDIAPSSFSGDKKYTNPNERNENDQTPIMVAAYNGDMQAAADLIGEGADVNLKDPKGYTALMFAAAKGHLEMVTILLKHRAFIDQKTTDGFTALYLAVVANHSKVAKLLIDRGSRTSITYEGKNLLILASMYGALDSVKLLVKRGLNPHMKDFSGKTSIDYAIQYKRKKIVLFFKMGNK